jgi:hypothetical protein
VLSINPDGNPIGAGAKSYRVMVPSELRWDTEEKRSSIEIQFWKISYDPRTRHVRASLAETFVFSPEELFRPPEENNS